MSELAPPCGAAFKDLETSSSTERSQLDVEARQSDPMLMQWLPMPFQAQFKVRGLHPLIGNIWWAYAKGKIGCGNECDT